MAYSKILRRLREEKTNYRKRGTMLMGKRDFITVNISNSHKKYAITWFSLALSIFLFYLYVRKNTY